MKTHIHLIKTHGCITVVKPHTATHNMTVTHQHEFHKSKLFSSGMAEFFENELTEKQINNAEFNSLRHSKDSGQES